MRIANLSTRPLPILDPLQPLQDWPGEHVVVGGQRFHVRRTAGAAAASQRVVLIHGIGDASNHWTNLTHLLAGTVHVDALDLPGFGLSEPFPHGRYEMHDHAEAVVAFLRSKTDNRVHLAGHSMGGVVALLAAAQAPDTVATLTLISPAMPDLRPNVHQAQLGMLAIPVAGEAMRRTIRALPRQHQEDWMVGKVYAEPSRIPKARRRQLFEEWETWQDLRHGRAAFDMSMRALIRAYLSHGGSQLWSRASQLPMPTLLIWGDRDRLVSPRLAPKLAAKVPDCRVLLLPGVGHVPQVEASETVVRAMLAMLEEAPNHDGGERGSNQLTWNGFQHGHGEADPTS